MTIYIKKNLGLILLLSGLFVIWFTLSDFRTAPKIPHLVKQPVENKTLLASVCENKKTVSCYVEIINNLKFPLSTTDIRELYEELNVLKNKKNITSQDCHFISHEIGKLAVINQQNISKLFQLNFSKETGDSACNNGFYHGVMMGFTKKYSDKQDFDVLIRKIIQEAQKDIDESGTNKDVKENYLYHSIGHSIYLHYGDTVKGIEVCEVLVRTEKSRLNYCLIGVFMGESFEFLEAGVDMDINYCARTDQKYRQSCYSAVRYGKDQLEKDRIQYSNLCVGEKDTRTKLSCIMSFVVQSVRKDVEQKHLNVFCENISDPKYQEICKYQYLKLYFIIYPNSEKAGQIYKETCYTMNILDSIRCKKILSGINSNTTTDNYTYEDLVIPKLQFADIKYLFLSS